MSQIKSVNSIAREIDRLNAQFDKMVAAGNAFLAFLFSPVLFEDYANYHTLLTIWSNNLITIHPALPNDNLPQANVSSSFEGSGEPHSLFGGASEISLIKAIVLFAFSVPMFAVSATQVMPWAIPIAYVGAVTVYLCGGAQLFERYLNKPKLDEEPDLDTDNPGDWIAKDLQKMSDLYDNLRTLIFGQNTSAERLAESYQKQDVASFSRHQQERELFPNECLTIFRKVNVFCTNAYYERKDQLISHYPVANPVPQPQFPMGPNQ